MSKFLHVLVAAGGVIVQVANVVASVSGAIPQPYGVIIAAVAAGIQGIAHAVAKSKGQAAA